MTSKARPQSDMTVWSFLSELAKKPWAIPAAALFLVLVWVGIRYGGLLLGYSQGWKVETQSLRNIEIRSDRTIIQVQSREEACERSAVVVPTFSSTISSSGDATNGEYGNELADIVAVAFARLYPTKLLDYWGDARSLDTSEVLQLADKEFAGAKYRVLRGRVHEYSDEVPSQGRRAAISATLRLISADGKTIGWQAMSTMTARSAKQAVGEEGRVSGLLAVEIAARFADELAEALRAELGCEDGTPNPPLSDGPALPPSGSAAR